jgi:hypothetical protein
MNEMPDEIEAAPLYVISRDMCDLAWFAAASMPNEPLLASELPSETGFIALSKNFIVEDIRGTKVSVSAFSWRTHRIRTLRSYTAPLITTNFEDMTVVKDVIVFDIWSDRDEIADESLQSLVKEWKVDLGAAVLDVPKYVILGQSIHAIGAPDKDPNAIAEELGIPLDRAMQAVVMHARFPRALWVLMKQRLHVERAERADRPTRRRLARQHSPLAERFIKVVTLRRIEERKPTEGEAQHVERTHRWIVSGHWRNQWYAAERMHRLIWIHPFIKGPDDMPLVEKRVVTRLVR